MFFFVLVLLSLFFSNLISCAKLTKFECQYIGEPQTITIPGSNMKDAREYLYYRPPKDLVKLYPAVLTEKSYCYRSSRCDSQEGSFCQLEPENGTYESFLHGMEWEGTLSLIDLTPGLLVPFEAFSVSDFYRLTDHFIGKGLAREVVVGSRHAPIVMCLSHSYMQTEDELKKAFYSNGNNTPYDLEGESAVLYGGIIPLCCITLAAVILALLNHQPIYIVFLSLSLLLLFFLNWGFFYSSPGNLSLAFDVLYNLFLWIVLSPCWMFIGAYVADITGRQFSVVVCIVSACLFVVQSVNFAIQIYRLAPAYYYALPHVLQLHLTGANPTESLVSLCIEIVQNLLLLILLCCFFFNTALHTRLKNALWVISAGMICIAGRLIMDACFWLSYNGNFRDYIDSIWNKISLCWPYFWINFTFAILCLGDMGESLAVYASDVESKLFAT